MNGGTYKHHGEGSQQSPPPGLVVSGLLVLHGSKAIWCRRVAGWSEWGLLCMWAVVIEVEGRQVLGYIKKSFVA